MKYAIILAGGIGKRFWPLSKVDTPKQFLRLFSKASLLEETVLRVKEFIDLKNIHIATSILYKKRFNRYIKKLGLKKTNLLFEPEIKNTFSPIAYLTYKILKDD
ncbi:MAG: sugar phosphate nucleotidyltransferase, partial [Candidatus Omnitrophica bacterium]|nr:sugar phosphate nucleotidyltransferase [Candidatus Omnitrophota bacterium]